LGTVPTVTEEHEPRLYALGVEPQCARSGEIVQITFRQRNHGSRAAPAARLRFVVPPGLEPQGPVEVALAATAPGDEAAAGLSLRVATGLDDRTELRVEGRLEAGDTVRSTNVCIITVRTAARLDGDASGTVVERVDAQTVRVIASAVNDGDGPALDALLTVRAPAGCVPADGEVVVTAAAARLEPGETLAAAMVARIVHPLREVRADDCEVAWCEGSPRALAVTRALVLEPELLEPELRVVPDRGRAELVAEIRNDGWADALDVAVAIALAPELRVVDGTLVVDGVRYALRAGRGNATAAVRITRARSPIQLALTRVPARGLARLALTFACAPGAAPAAVTLSAGLRTATALIASPASRDIRLRVVEAPAWIEPSGSARLVIEVFNAGERSHTLCLAFDCAETAADSVRVDAPPRTLRCAEFALRAGPRATQARETLHGTIVATDGDEICARLDVALPLRDRVWLALDGPPAISDGRIEYAIRNTGPTIARDLRTNFKDAEVTLETLPPGAATAVVIDEAAARRGGLLYAGEREALVLPPADHPRRPDLTSALEVPPEVVCGAVVPVHLTIAAHDAIDALDVRVVEPASTYVPGSTTIDGRTVAEIDGPTHLARGLRLRGIVAGTRIRVGWSLLVTAVPAGGTLEVGASLRFHGERREVTSERVAVREREPYLAGWEGAGYVVDALPADCDPAWSAPAPQAAAAIASQPAIAAASDDDGVTFAFRSDWHDAARRLLQGGEGDGLLRHILALRALFPDREFPPDDELASALAGARTALRDVFDRAFVKMRIPGFPVAAEDIEDAPLRLALTALFEAVATAPRCDGEAPAGSVCVRLDRGSARAASGVLTTAPYGAPGALRTLTLLVPAESREDEAAVAVARYMRALDGALKACTDLPLEAFDRALGSGRYPELDAARTALVAAIAPRASRAAP
jgi:hypothetical protein